MDDDQQPSPGGNRQGDVRSGRRVPTSRSGLYRPALVAAGIGLLLSLLAAYAVGRWEQRVTRVEFEGVAATELIEMQNGVNEYLSRLVALRTLFESANEEITRSEFEVFSGRLFENHPGILRVGWLPKIYRKERAEYEAAAVNDGVAGYRIKSLAGDGALRRRRTSNYISRSSFPPSQKPRWSTGWTIQPTRCDGRRCSVRGTMTRSRRCRPNWFTI